MLWPADVAKVDADCPCLASRYIAVVYYGNVKKVDMQREVAAARESIAALRHTLEVQRQAAARATNLPV